MRRDITPSDPQVLRDLPRLREKLETLTAERPRALAQAAVRRGDLAELARLTPASRPAGAANPSADEFDALVRDVHRLMEALRTIGSALA